MATPFQVYQEYKSITVNTPTGQRQVSVQRYRNAGIPSTLGPDWRRHSEDMVRNFRASSHHPTRDSGAFNASPDSRTFTAHTRHGPREVSFAPVADVRIALAFQGKLTPTDLKYFLEVFARFWPNRQAPLWAPLGAGSEPPFQALADSYLGADCNSFVASYVLRSAPSLFHGTERSIDAYRNRRTLRPTPRDIRPGDLLIWGTNNHHDNAHIAAVGECAVSGNLAHLTLAQAASDTSVRGIDYRRGFVLSPNTGGNAGAPVPNLFRLRAGAISEAYVDVYGIAP